MEKARQRAEQDAAVLNAAVVAPGAQEQEEGDVLDRDEEDDEDQDDHVGRGDVAENIGLIAGVDREVSNMRSSVAVINEDIRPVIASLNRQQMMIYENVSNTH